MEEWEEMDSSADLQRLAGWGFEEPSCSSFAFISGAISTTNIVAFTIAADIEPFANIVAFATCSNTIPSQILVTTATATLVLFFTSFSSFLGFLHLSSSSSQFLLQDL